MKLQKWKRKILAVILAVGIFAGSVAANGTQAAAAEQRAAGLAELAQVIRDNGMQRKAGSRLTSAEVMRSGAVCLMACHSFIMI